MNKLNSTVVTLSMASLVAMIGAPFAMGAKRASPFTDPCFQSSASATVPNVYHIPRDDIVDSCDASGGTVSTVSVWCQNTPETTSIPNEYNMGLCTYTENASKTEANGVQVVLLDEPSTPPTGLYGVANTNGD